MKQRLLDGWISGRKKSTWASDNRNLMLAMLGGAGLMYLFDPARGNRRRAELWHQATRAAHKTGDALGTTSRDLANRTQGLLSPLTSLFQGGEADDRVIGARVRAHWAAWSHTRARLRFVPRMAA
jgi:hypothetical protein